MKTSDEILEIARKMFVPPFRAEMGYVWDANGEMVVTVRAWGRVKYMVESESEGIAVHDALGELIATALNVGWPK